LRGGLIGSGTGPVGVIVDAIATFQKIIVRIAEMKGNYPFRTSASAPKQLLKQFGIRANQPAIGSYKFTVRLTTPEQGVLFQDPHHIPVDEVAAFVVPFVQAAASGDGARVAELVPQLEYRDTLVRLLDNFLPPRDEVAEVEISVGGH